MNKKFKYGSLITVLAVLMAVVTCVFAFSNPALAGVYVDGNSKRYGDSAGDIAGKYNVLSTNPDIAILGYRFSVLEDNGEKFFNNVGSIDVFRTNPHSNVYDRHLRITAGGKTFYNLDKYSYNDKYSIITKAAAEAWDTNSKHVTTGTIVNGYYNWTLQSDLGIELPWVGGQNAWANTPEKMDKVLAKISTSYSLANLNAEQYVLMEPIIAVRIDGDPNKERAYAITETEIALIGRLTLGDDSDGTESGGWSAIRDYTNKVFASSLYTSEYELHSDLEIQNGSALSGRATFQTIFEKGYGLLIVLNHNSYDIEYVLNQGSFETENNTIKTIGSYNRAVNPTYAYYNMNTPGTNNSYFYVENPTRTGYTFQGWKITGMDNCTHYSYYGGADHTFTTNSYNASTSEFSFKNLRQSKGNEPVRFTALWKANDIAIEYYVDNEYVGVDHYQTSDMMNNGDKVLRNHSVANRKITAWNFTYTYDGVTESNDYAQGSKFDHSIMRDILRASGGGSTIPNGTTIKLYAKTYVRIVYCAGEGTLGNTNYALNTGGKYNSGIAVDAIYNVSSGTQPETLCYYNSLLGTTGLYNYGSSFKLTSTGKQVFRWQSVNNPTGTTVQLYDETTQYAFNDFAPHANSNGNVYLRAIYKALPTIKLYYCMNDQSNINVGNTSYTKGIWTEKGTPENAGSANNDRATIMNANGTPYCVSITASGLSSTQLDNVLNAKINSSNGLAGYSDFGLSKPGYVPLVDDGSSYPESAAKTTGNVWGGKLAWNGGATSFQRYFNETYTGLTWKDILTSSEIEKFKNGDSVSRNIYVCWQPAIYTITCNFMDGVIDSSRFPTTYTEWRGESVSGNYKFYEKYSVGYYKDSAATGSISKIDVPTKINYVFGGYYTGKNGTGTQIVDAEGNIKVANTYFTANTTIYALWLPTITIQYCTNPYTGVSLTGLNYKFTKWSDQDRGYIDIVSTGERYQQKVNATSLSSTQLDAVLNSAISSSSGLHNYSTFGTFKRDGYHLQQDDGTSYPAGTMAANSGYIWFTDLAWDGSTTARRTFNENNTTLKWKDILTTEEIEKFKSGVSVNRNLYVYWSDIWTATFDMNGGTWPSTNSQYDATSNRTKDYQYTGILYASNWYDGCLNFPFTKEGYAFAGWKVTSCSDGNWTVGDIYPDNFLANASGKYGTVTFTAQWTPITYNISYDLKGGSFAHANNTDYVNSSGIKFHQNPTTSKYIGTPDEGYNGYFYVERPTREGYTFAGWTVTNMDSCEHHYYDSNNTGNKNQTSTATTWSNTSAPGNCQLFYNLRSTSGTVTFTANWTPETYNIYYYLDDVNVYSDTYTYGTGKSPLYSLAAATGKTNAPAGNTTWYTSTEKTTTATSISATETGDKNFYKYSSGNTYTITYRWRDDDSVISTDSYTYGTAKDLMLVPAVDHYTVTNQGTRTWFTGKTGTDTATKISATDTGNKTFYAEKTLTQYKATFKTNSGKWDSDSTTANKVFNYTYGTAINITDSDTVSRSGYRFLGWKVTASSGNWNVNETLYTNAQIRSYTNKYGDVTFTAQWEQQYTATFRPNSGTWNDSTTANKSVTYSPTIKIKVPGTVSRNYYHFSGWKVLSSVGTWTKDDVFTADEIEAKTGMTGNVTFVAQWTPYTYTVRFHANGGTGTMADQKFTYDVAQNLSSLTFAPATGYHLVSGYVWNTKADGTGTKYRDAQSVKNLVSTDNGYFDLYAQWEINTSTLKVVPNGGSWNGTAATSTLTKAYNTTIDIPVPTRNGYTFKGWTKSTPFYGTISSLTEQATYKFGADNGVTSTITANWEEIQDEQYKATFVPNGGKWTTGTSTGNRTAYYTVKTAISVPGTLNRNGYEFEGWKVTASNGTWKVGAQYTTEQIQSKIGETGNVTFTAVFGFIIFNQNSSKKMI